MTPGQTPEPTFQNLGIRPNLLAALEKMFPGPTPIQHRVIPVAIEGKDVVGIAQTGTGKTLAFGVPMLQHLAGHQGQGLVLVPTRELAMQVEEMLMKIGREFHLKVALIIGGAAMGPQVQALHRKPHIVVATPGRLMDLMQQKRYNLDNISVVVLDEADRMLDIGFMPQIKQILAAAPKERQTMLFSATMPSAIAQIAAQFMKQPLRIEVAPAGTTAAKVEQVVYFVARDQKTQLVEKMLTDHPGTVLIFTRTKFGAKKLTHSIKEMGHTAIEIHSNRSLAQRKEALQGFKNGKYRVLVATDIAARGIDVKDISLVINVDVPDNTDDYVHRIGRTGRAGGEGKAVTFATPDQKSDIRDIERLIRKQIPTSPLPTLPARRAVPQIEQGPMGGGRSPRGDRFSPRTRGPLRPYSGGRMHSAASSSRSAYGAAPGRSSAPARPAYGAAPVRSSVSSRPAYGAAPVRSSAPARPAYAAAPSRSSAPERPRAEGRPHFPSNPNRPSRRPDAGSWTPRPSRAPMGRPAMSSAPSRNPVAPAGKPSYPVIHSGEWSDENQYTPPARKGGRGGGSRGRSGGGRSSGGFAQKQYAWGSFNGSAAAPSPRSSARPQRGGGYRGAASRPRRPASRP